MIITPSMLDIDEENNNVLLDSNNYFQLTKDDQIVKEKAESLIEFSFLEEEDNKDQFIEEKEIAENFERAAENFFNNLFPIMNKEDTDKKSETSDIESKSTKTIKENPDSADKITQKTQNVVSEIGEAKNVVTKVETGDKHISTDDKVSKKEEDDQKGIDMNKFENFFNNLFPIMNKEDADKKSETSDIESKSTKTIKENPDSADKITQKTQNVVSEIGEAKNVVTKVETGDKHISTDDKVSKKGKGDQVLIAKNGDSDQSTKKEKVMESVDSDISTLGTRVDHIGHSSWNKKFIVF